MIYETVYEDAPIRQGDIFRHVPRVDLALKTLPILRPDGTATEIDWQDVVQGSADPVTAIVAVKPVLGIVISQNCDTARGPYISLCEIDEFTKIYPTNHPSTPKAWEKLITRHAKQNYRYFYLPEDARLGLTPRMAVDFRMVIQAPRTDLENLRGFRIGRLNSLATEHFRECIAHFFRRYAYNEWYPLTKAELDAYAADSPEGAQPYPWQEGAPEPPGGPGNTAA